MSGLPNFTPACCLKNPHLQTIWPTLLRRPIDISLTRQRVELPDGDFVDLDWANNSHRPLAVIFHGLEGSSKSNYVRGMISALTAQGWNAVVMNFRGCSGEPNRLARAYHSGDTGDISFVINQLRQQHPSNTVAAIGYSLGGNALLKYLAETGSHSQLDAAIAVSVPFDLNNAALTLQTSGFGIYQRYLLKQLKTSVLNKRDCLESIIDINTALASTTFHQFDHHVTAQLHGFSGVDDYYAQSSSNQYIPDICTPTLIVHAQDDPFLNKSAIPPYKNIPKSVEMLLSNHGGHVGFIDSQGYWLERTVPAFLKQFV